VKIQNATTKQYTGNCSAKSFDEVVSHTKYNYPTMVTEFEKWRQLGYHLKSPLVYVVTSHCRKLKITSLHWPQMAYTSYEI